MLYRGLTNERLTHVNIMRLPPFATIPLALENTSKLPTIVQLWAERNVARATDLRR